ncbi:MAG: YitT family protein [Methanobrevibacter sp.]
MKARTRLINYFVGLFIMTVGIAFSIKSNLGVSPVSTIPYTMTVVWGIEIGMATIIFHCGLVILQISLLRKSFQRKQLLQVPVGVVFGYFTSFSVYLLSFIPSSSNIIISLIYLAISIVAIAFGIFLYLPPKLIPLAGEGAMATISAVSGIPFEKVKIYFDTSMVVISLIICLVMIRSLGSVGIGTIISAFLVGSTLKLITSIFEHFKGYNPMLIKPNDNS